MKRLLLNNQPESRSRAMLKTRRPNAVARILTALFVMLLIPQGLWAQGTYLGVTIKNNGSFYGVFTTNVNDVLGDGTVSFDVGEKGSIPVLTLKGAKIKGCIFSEGDLIIDLQGDNYITATDSSCIKNIAPEHNVTTSSITPSDNLEIKSTGNNGNLMLIQNISEKNILYYANVSYPEDFLKLGSYNTPQESAVFTSQLLGGGNGSADAPYLISSPSDIKNLAKYVNSGLLPTAGKNFELTQHINGSELDSFEPIGGRTKDFPYAQEFHGSFDGGNYTISNIVYNPTTIDPQTNDGICLFGYVSEGTVKDLKLSNCTFGGGYCNGAIAEFLTSGTIENCTVTSCTIEGGRCGGVAGYVNDATTNSTIVCCTVDRCTIQNGDLLGGIAGEIAGGVSIQNCTVDGCTISSTENNAKIGGITPNNSSGSISGCIVKGTNITCDATSTASAIVPDASDGIFVGNYYYADVTITIGGTTKSGHTQRGTSIPDNDQNYDVFVDDGIVLYTKPLTLSENGVHWDIRPYTGSYYKSDGNVLYVAPGQPLDFIVVPNDSRLPKDASLTYTPANSAELQTDIIPNTSTTGYYYHFLMPDDAATFTLDYAINLGHDSFTCLYNNTTNYSTDFTALAVVLPTTITMDDGKTITPLTQGTDYTIDGYKDWQKQALNSTPVNAGTYYVTIKGKDNYTGTTDVQFTISRIDLKNVTVASISNQTYTGSPIEPAITATLNGVVINANEYGVAYTNNTNVTTANAPATVTLSANGYSFTGGSTKTATFKIVAKALTDAMVTLSATTFTYNGSAQKPTVTVKDGNKTLTENTDYTLTNAGGTAVGTYNVVVAGKGNYSGSITKQFTISAKALTDAMVTLSASTFTYNGSAQKPTVTVKDGNKTLTENTDYTLTNAGGTAVGTYDVVVAGKGNYSGSITKQFTISANTGALTVTPATTSYTYDGTEKKPAVTVKSGTATLTEKSDYTIAYSNNINAGTATITVTGKGNYAGATGTATFTINKAAGSISYETTTINKTEGDAAFTNDLTYSGDGTVTFASTDKTVATINESGVVTILKAGTTTITATVTDGKNYTYATNTATYTLNVERAIVKYDLWIGTTQVTEDNLNNVLGDNDKTFQYFPTVNKLFITNSNGQSIESRINEGLTIYLAPSSNNKLQKIVSTVAAPLTITTDGNYPGGLELETTDGNVIEGFSSLSLEQNLSILKPDNVKYLNNALTASKGIIGIVIETMVEEEKVSLDDQELKDNPLMNYVYNDKVLMTLNNTQDPDGDGWDDSGTPGIVLNSAVSDEVFDLLNMDETAPGTQKFAEIFTGLTILIPGGEGLINIDAETHDGYCIKLKSLFGDELKKEMTTNEERTVQTFNYKFDAPTFVGIYNGGKSGNAARNKMIRPGRKTVTHIKIYNATISPGKVNAANPAGAASGGLYTGPVPAVGQDVENPTEITTGIKDVEHSTFNIEHATGKWYNLNGQQINEPSMKGLYIRNGKKIMIK